MTDPIDQGLQAGISFLRETRAGHLLAARVAREQAQTDLLQDLVNLALQAHRTVLVMRRALRLKWELEWEVARE